MCVFASRSKGEVGDLLLLTGKTLVSAVRPPLPYGGELLTQLLFALRQCFFPLVVTIDASPTAVPGLQAANFLILFSNT